MTFPAKYLEFRGSVDQLTASISSVAGGLYDTENLVHGYHGMDHYWSFSVKSLSGQVMVRESPDLLSVVVFTMPNMIQKAKARELLDQILVAIPGAVSRPFPGGKGGLLKFS